MRLTQIRLAGFKSFVDPTQIPVPGQLVAVVGPNGCGKSNVIDAVRWVLGESSAKQLRGESMQDVIFNGSTTRKPVSRANVELVFDNSQGRAAGQWSQYGEIAIKRQLTRAGESSYFINNLQVRRRDITDLFLGTGVGTRGYAVIEQGMISRIIEARPEDLRLFLEEAAGVSKYKERRRETESRLSDTRENLSRVDDILQELTKQLVRLETQAAVAQEYHQFQQRLVQSQNLYSLVRKLEAQRDRAKFQLELEKLVTQLEGEMAKVREAEARLEQLRQEHYVATDDWQAAQGLFYESNTEVGRLEQQIKHVSENRERLGQQVAALRNQLGQIEQQLQRTAELVAYWQTQLSEAEAKTAIAAGATEELAGDLPDLEQDYRVARDRWQSLQKELAGAERALQLEETHRSHAEKSRRQLAGRHERLQAERNRLSLPDLATLQDLREELELAELRIVENRDLIEEGRTALANRDAARRACQNEVQQIRQDLASAETRARTLQQLQDRAGDAAQLDQWLTARQLKGLARLWQRLQVDAGWEDALEAVLRERLQAMPVVDQVTALAWLEQPPPGKLTLYWPTPPHLLSAVASSLVPLRQRVRCEDPVISALLDVWLQGVYGSDQLVGVDLAHLPTTAIVVTPAGHRLDHISLSFFAPDAGVHGMLQRQREIEELRLQVRQLQDKRDLGSRQVEEAEAAYLRQQQMIHDLQSDIQRLERSRQDLRMEEMRQTQLAEQMSQRAAQIDHEIAEIDGQLELEVEAQSEAEFKIAEYQEQVESLSQSLDDARDIVAQTEQKLAQARIQQQEAGKRQHEAQLYEQHCRSKINESETLVRHYEEQLEEGRLTLEERQFEWESQDDVGLQERLQLALHTRATREQGLAAARDRLEALAQNERELDQLRMQGELGLQPLRDRQGDIRLKAQEAELREQQFAEQLLAAQADEDVLRPLAEAQPRPSVIQAEIQRLTDAINSLGAVNLAAVEELADARLRKEYLDSQTADLNDAIETLEGAIRRIDRETRELLRATFEEVNTSLGELFPQLFGGGQARLILTGDEILDAGLQIMAQPPGKKNSTIHLLSGGEKALTALSLVFSLFRLNPAPFCLLDEVDAPLDDANTGRFCEMVKRMAEHTQFLYISHNKITMEMASQLVGITMQEQGVSRVVAVDIEQAVRMAEAV